MARKDRARATRDKAGVGPHAAPTARLTPMKELDGFKIASGEADIRGWDVRTLSGRALGRVEDLLVDAERGEVIMLDVDLENSDRHTLAPIRAAQIDRERKLVVIDSADLERDVPSLRRSGALSAEEGQRFGESYERAYGDRGWQEGGEYVIRRGGEETRFGRREAGLGAGTADATGTTDASGREIYVERRAAAAPESEAKESREQSREVRFPRADDEIVVEQRPVVVEEVVVRRRVIDSSSPDADRPETR